MKALPTLHRGVTFRSRLEADWAATLDSLDIAWDYEPEGYKLSDGTYYSPDFYLPASGAWLEVKGAHMERVSKVEQFAAECERTVILGLSPTRLGSFEHPRIVGVSGPGRRFSVFIMRCPECKRHTFAAREWAQVCPCNPEPAYSDLATAFGYSNVTHWADFVRVPRPVGRGR